MAYRDGLLRRERASECFAGHEKAQGRVVNPMKIETLIGSVGGDLKDELVEELLHRSRRKVDSALKRIRRPEAAVGVVKSPLGDLLVATSARGIALAHYLHDDSDLTVTVAKLRSEFDPVEDQRAVAEVGNEVRRYLAGDLEALRQNIDLTLVGHSFRKKAFWTNCRAKSLAAR